MNVEMHFYVLIIFFFLRWANNDLQIVNMRWENEERKFTEWAESEATWMQIFYSLSFIHLLT